MTQQLQNPRILSSSFIRLWSFMTSSPSKRPSPYVVLIILLVLMCCSVQPLLAATYYVSKSGNNSDPGTKAQPWLTIQKAADTMVAGDTVYVQPGTYAEKVTETTSGTAVSPISYIADGSVTAGGFYVSSSYVNIDGFTLNGTLVGINDSCINFRSTGGHRRVTNVATVGTAGSIVAGVGGVSSLGANDYFENITVTNPNYHAFIIATDSDGTTVNGCTVTMDTGQDVFRIQTSNVTISGCIISVSNPYHNPNHCDIFQAFADDPTDVSQNVIIEKCIVLNAPDYQLGNFTDDKDNNHISNWTFRNNVFTNVATTMNLMAPNFKFYNNVFYKVGYPNSAMAVTGTCEPVVTGTDGKHYRVIFYDGSNPHYASLDDRPSDGPNWRTYWAETTRGANATWSVGRLYKTVGCDDNTTYINNIFYQCGYDTTAKNKGWYWFDVGSIGGVADYNLVVGTGAGTTKTGFNEVHGLNGVDPLFVDPANPNFNLREGSPAIAKGKNLYELFSNDLLGAQRDSTLPWDLGAITFQAMPTPETLAAPQRLRISP